MNLEQTSKMLLAELQEQIIPFWESYSLDHINGGFYTSIDSKGAIFDTDKFVWLQARQVWTFAMLFDELSAEQRWLDISIKGAKFLLNHGRDKTGSWYFAVDKEGQPLVAPYNIFSDCFATMAFARLFKITGDTLYKDVTLQTFDNILKRRENPKGKYNKAVVTSRQLSNFSLPMILCNLCQEMDGLLDKNQQNLILSECLDLVMHKHFNKNLGLIMENVDFQKGFSNTYDGRLINPGHGIEAMWFIIDLAERNNDLELIQKCIAIIHTTLEFSWDDKYGGIYYFMDVLGKPTQQLEWDQKLWWVHLEVLIALSKSLPYDTTGKTKQWFKKVFEYTWTSFRDPIHQGEWFGYLNRQGEVLLNLKGGKWKGCFHVPRALLQTYKALSKCI